MRRNNRSQKPAFEEKLRQARFEGRHNALSALLGEVMGLARSDKYKDGKYDFMVGYSDALLDVAKLIDELQGNGRL